MNKFNDKELIEKIQYISKKYNLEVFILFGSRAKNENKLSSDWDFAFFSKNMTIRKEIKIFEDLMKALSFEKIDLINISTNHDVKIRNEIFQEGICLYEKKSGIFSSMKGAAWIDYIDFQRFEKNRIKFLKKDIEESLA